MEGDIQNKDKSWKGEGGVGRAQKGRPVDCGLGGNGIEGGK